MSRRSLFSVVVAATVASLASSMAHAKFEYDTSYYAFGCPAISLDVSHDLVLIGVDGDRAKIRVLMFDPAEFSEVPSFDDYSLDELEDMAADIHEFSHSLSILFGIRVSCAGGNDVVLTLPSFPRRLRINGGDGDDHLEGGAADDILDGGDDDDDLFGREGDDELMGGRGLDYLSGGGDDDVLLGSFDDHSDRDCDRLQGDGGNDYFLQFYTVEPYTVRTRSGELMTLGRRVYEEVILDATAGDTVVSHELP